MNAELFNNSDNLKVPIPT